jgi:hypothetical protein
MNDAPPFTTERYAPHRGAPPILDVLDAGDDDQPIPPREWLLGVSFCRQFVSALIGGGGCGKTSVRIVQALSLATGRPLTGEYVFLQAIVLIICLEDGMTELRRRVRAAMKYHKIEAKDVKGHLFLTTPSRLKMAQYGEGNAVVPGDLDAALRKLIDGKRIDLVIIDPVVKAHAVKENDNRDMDAVVSILAGLAIEGNIAVDILAHERKTLTPTAGDADRMRGATAIKDGARLVYTLTAMSEQEAQAFNVSESERRSLVRLDSAKVNLCPAQEARWFRLIGVALDNGNDVYRNGDEVGTVEPWKPPALFDGFSTSDLNAALDKLRDGMGDGRRYSTSPQAKERAAWRVLQEICPSQSEATCRRIIATWVKNDMFTIGEYHDEKARKDFEGIIDAKRMGEPC